MSPIGPLPPPPAPASLAERLYQRLPRIYRQRDLEEGEPLRALMAVMERELELLEADVEGLYENQFLETCQEWAVPYLAELLGLRTLGLPPLAGANPRTQLANNLEYRRRKGTPLVIERTLHDLLGIFARVVEYFDFLAHTQNVSFVRPGRGGTFDVRRAGELERPGDPFANPVFTWTVDVHRIASKRGRFNLPNLGIFLWRLISFLVPSSPALPAVGDVSGQRFLFDPLGRDVPLFNRGAGTDELVRRAAEHDLPVALTRAILGRDLAENDPSLYYGADKAFYLEADSAALPSSSLVVADLGDWISVPPALSAGQVAIDPERGRFFFESAPASPASVRVRYCYGFAGPLAGGPYDRSETLTAEGAAALVLTVSKGGSLPAISDALAVWDAQGKPNTVIRVADSEIYVESLTLELAANACLALEAADGARPVLVAPSGTPSMQVVGAGKDSELLIHGFWIDGAIALEESLRLWVLHSTLAPRAGQSSVTHSGDASELRVCLRFSISGALDGLPGDLASLVVEDCILELSGGGAGGAAGPPISLARSTVFGPLLAEELVLASEVIFTEPVLVTRLEVGCVRYCYLPPGSETPRRFRCQPDAAVELAVHRALEQRARRLGLAAVDRLSEAERVAVTAAETSRTLERLLPRFTSTLWGDAGYAQLALDAAPELRAGAENGSELGVFSFLDEPRRRAQLRELLEEFLRFGVEAGIFEVT